MSMLMVQNEASVIFLKKGQFWRPAMGNENLSVKEGSLWLTSEGCRDDIILSPGESLALAGLQTVLVEALNDSVFLSEWKIS